MAAIVESATKRATPLGESSARPLIAREVFQVDREAWDAFVAGFPYGNIMQAWSWGEYKRQSGWLPVRIALFCDGVIVAAAQMLVRKAFGVAIAYVPRGPLCDDSDTVAYRALLDVLHYHARHHHAVFLRLGPNQPFETPVEGVLRRRGFVPADKVMRPKEPWSTFLVDLTGGPDAVLSRMQKKTRQHAKGGSKRFGLRVSSCESDIVAFHQMMLDLAGRKHISAKPVHYYESILDELRPREEATLMLAELEGKVIAGIIALRFGKEGFFFQSAALAAYQNTHVNQFLQWKAMEWCMEHGCTRYDLGGIVDLRTMDENGKTILLPIDPDAMDPELKGLFSYKKSFGGELVRYAGAFDYAYNPMLYRYWRRMGNLQASGTDVLHMLQNRLDGIRLKIQSKGGSSNRSLGSGDTGG